LNLWEGKGRGFFSPLKKGGGKEGETRQKSTCLSTKRKSRKLKKNLISIVVLGKKCYPEKVFSGEGGKTRKERGTGSREEKRTSDQQNKRSEPLPAPGSDYDCGRSSVLKNGGMKSNI